MKGYWVGAALTFAIVTASEPAHACMIFGGLDLNDIHYADVVVIGRISNYKIVIDTVVRQKRKEMLASSPDMPVELRKILTEQTVFLSDYARFDVQVDEVLVGKAPKTLSVTWDNSTFGEPEKLSAGPFLIALRDPSSGLPPLRGPSATILSNPEPGSLTVLQAPCSKAFIFENSGEKADAVRQILGARSK